MSTQSGDRFVTSVLDGEEQLKSQTVGLIQLDDFRKRRAAALDSPSSSTTPSINGDSSAKPVIKRRKVAKKGGVSFNTDDDDVDNSYDSQPSLQKNQNDNIDAPIIPKSPKSDLRASIRLTANSALSNVPSLKSKTVLAREEALKSDLRQTFLATQARVKATDFCIKFVFHEGVDIVGGECRVKKGDQVWQFLDSARRIGAGMASASAAKVKQLARASVDDLMMVRDGIILPNHYEFYYFMINMSQSYNGALFGHSADVTSASPESLDCEGIKGGLSLPDTKAIGDQKAQTVIPLSDLEGWHELSSMTKVVNRIWYEKNKHIYPYSAWEIYDPEKDYTTAVRRDAQGNAFFAK